MLLSPLLVVSSVVWVPLVATGVLECSDVARVWGFCGIYVYNSMAVQMVVHGGLDD